MQLVLATHNKNKLREVKDFLADLPLEIVSLENFPDIQEIEETGSTFQENALIKALAIKKHCPNSLIIADDSGLCVQALNGSPGVFSARYAGVGATQQQLCQKLLSELHGIENRQAFFVSVYAVLFPGEKEIFVQGELHGEISHRMIGTQGFGYDPLFLYEGGFGKTLAEISLVEKNKISHRAKALTQVKQLISRKLLG